MPTDTVDTEAIDAAIHADLAAQEADAPSIEEDQPAAPAEQPTGTDDAVVDSSQDSTPQDSVDSGDEPVLVALPDGTEVPLDELIKGNMRQADYTRKTQALAAEREQAEQALRLLAALNEDPEGTLQVLTETLVGADTEDLDPIQAQLKQHEQFIQQQEEMQLEAQLDAMLTAVADEFGDFDREAVVEHAIQEQIPNLRAAYLDYKHVSETQAERAKRNAEALARKRGAVKVAGRSSAADGDAPVVKQVDTIYDAVDNALAELGVKWE